MDKSPNNFQKYKFSMLLGLVGLLIGIYVLVYSFFNYPYDLGTYAFFNLIAILILIGTGLLFDKGKTEIGFITLGVVFAVLPFFSDLTAPSILELNPYQVPWLLMFILPQSLQSGHPPAAIFIVPFIWIILGIISAIVWHYRSGVRSHA